MSRTTRVLLLASAAVLGSVPLLRTHAFAEEGTGPKAVVHVAATQHDDREAAAAFEAIVPVLHNPRCINCHAVGDYPRQGDDSHRHIMEVRRGPDGHGASPVLCSTCHQDHNLVGVHMPPGAPDWALPSPAMPMIWEGLTDHQLCELLKDPQQNGHRTVAQIVQHMGTPLVLWGWHPGEGRTPVSMPQEQFLAEVKLWAAKGAACPAGAGGHPVVDVH